jgi:hypothetical protein
MRILVAVGEAVDSVEDLPAGVSTLLASATEILVMSPSEVTRVEWLTGGVDEARRVADERLSLVLGQLDDVGATATGAVGDELVAVAFGDALRDFAADHIVIALRRADRAKFRRRQIIDRLLEEFGVPITVFIAGG